MRHNYPAIKCLLAILLLLPCAIISAQNYDGLNGEKIISTGNFRYNTVVASENRLYSQLVINSNLTSIAYDGIWAPPEPYKIVKIAVKQVINPVTGNYNRSYDQLMVLLNNGSVYRISVNINSGGGGVHFDTEEYWGKAGSGGSETWKKILGDDIYVLSNKYLYTSKDSSTWTVDSAGLNGATVNDVFTDTLQKVFVATNKGLFVQTGGSHAFTSVSTYSGPQSIGSIFIDRKNRVWIGTGSGVYKSDDAITWVIDTAGAYGLQPNIFTDDAFGNVYFACVYPGTGAYHIYKSAGGTQPWQVIDSSIYNITTKPPVIYSLTGDTILNAGTSFGNFISGDKGKTWVLANKGIATENISGIAKPSPGSLVASTPLGIYKKNGGNSNWNKGYPANGFISNLPLYDDRAGNIYTIDYTVKVTDTLGFLLKSSDGGNTWVPDTVGLGKLGGGNFFVDEKGNEHNGNSFYGPACNIWVKPKNGQWVLDTAGFNTATYSFIRNIVSDRKGYLYITGNFSGNKVMRRPVNGGKWVVDTAGVPASIFYFDRFTAGHGDVIGATNKLLFHRGTGIWAPVPLPAAAAGDFSPIRAISIDSSGYIFVAINVVKGSGVYFTSDLGATWKFCGLDSMDVSGMASYSDTTYVLTHNAGLFALTHNSVLPVTMGAVKTYQLGKGILVEWSGYNEVNMRGYIVERSANGYQFTGIGNVQAIANNAPQNNYNWFDAAPFSGDNFYRIKAIGKDGSAQYSGVVKVNIAPGKSGLTVFPNPAINKTINVQLTNIAAGSYTLIVYNTNGQKLYVRNMQHSGGNAGIAVNAGAMAAGTYWVVLKNNKTIYRKMVLIK